MGKKSKNDRLGVVYSTNPDYDYVRPEAEEPDAAPAAQQQLRVSIDRKQRKGKEVTLVTGFVGPDDELKELAKLLKTKCGVGGSAKDGEIVIQGNQRDKVVGILLEKGYRNTKKSGG